jgi:DNA-binding beta-propeller fold protein YncE
MTRRIDALHCKPAEASEKIGRKCEATKGCAINAKQEITKGFAELISALEKRRDELLAEADDLLKNKLHMLNDQAGRIAGMVGDKSIGDSENIRMRTDEVVSFNPKKKKELVDQISSFGKVDGKSTYASESSASGPLIEGPSKVGHKTWLLVKACDLHGVMRTDGGEKLNVKFNTDDSGPDHFEWKVEDNEDGTYKLIVVPQSVGEYTLTLSIANPVGMEGDEPIKGCPFKIDVQPPFDYTVLGDDTIGQAGKPWLEDEDVGFLQRPLGITFTPGDEFVFVSDSHNNRIQVFRADSKEAVCAFGQKGYGPKDFNSPGYLVVDRDNRVIITDILNHRLHLLIFNKEELSLRHVRTIGGPGTSPGKFNFPRGVELTAEGLLMVADCGNHRIQVLDTTKEFCVVREFGEHGEAEGKLEEPNDIAVNSLGEIFVTDSKHRVQVFDAQGVFLRAWGKKGRKSGMFRHPTCVTIDNQDSVFICDQGNHRVQVFTPEGSFVHAWGGYLKKVEVGEDGEPVQPDDGRETPLDDAQWYGMLVPADIAVSAAGKVLVSDYEKHVVFDF